MFEYLTQIRYYYGLHVHKYSPHFTRHRGSTSNRSRTAKTNKDAFLRNWEPFRKSCKKTTRLSRPISETNCFWAGTADESCRTNL